MRDAYNFSEVIYSEFKRLFQRNPIPDVNLSTISSPSIHSVNDRGQLITKRAQNDFGGTMSYKPFKEEAYEVVIRWDSSDAKASKDAIWFKERAAK